MQKLVLSLIAASAVTGSAFAADMAPKAYTKAPVMVAAAPSWTGCYVGGGGGYGLWNQENTGVDTYTGAPYSAEITSGGRGYFGTVQGGCDYQFAMSGFNLVVGGFGDYDFSSLKGKVSPPDFGNYVGSEKMSSAWSVGGRAGVLITPSFLTYFSAGYTEATFNATDFSYIYSSTPSYSIDKQTYKGYFIGAGDEYALSFMPGLFWKTEYRLSTFDTKRVDINYYGGGLYGDSMDSKKYVQTVRTELTYHFNWTGPVVAKY